MVNSERSSSYEEEQVSLLPSTSTSILTTSAPIIYSDIKPKSPLLSSNKRPFSVRRRCTNGSQDEYDNASHDIMNEKDSEMQSLHVEQEEDSFPSSQGLGESLSDFQPCLNISYWIVCLVILIGDTARGIMFPTLWPLVRHLGGSEQTQGFVVAAFSFGRVFASPYFGKMSVERGYFFALRMSLTILILGSVMYSFSEHMDRFKDIILNGTIYLLFAQMIMGIGSGTLGVTRAYVAEITNKSCRTKYMAQITAVQYAGFTVTPVIGSFFNTIFHFNDIFDSPTSLTSPYFLSAYSAPAYFLIFLSGITIILLHTKFHDRTPKKKMDEKHMLAPDVVGDSALLEAACPIFLFPVLKRYTLTNIAMSICILLNIVTKGSIACFETIGLKTATSKYGLSSSEAGTIVSTCGLFGVAILLSMGIIEKKYSDVQIIIGGIIFMLAGITSFVLAPVVQTMGIPGSWCYVLGIFLIYSIGYPLGHTAAMALFSKIVGKRSQGELMGWFASSGSVARVSFPILAGVLKGSNVLLYILISILSMAAMFVHSMQFILTTIAEAS